MTVYVQIGKTPRMAINGKIKEIRADFIKQIPSWKTLVPIYFYPNASTDAWSGVLLPYRIKYKDGHFQTYFFYIGEYVEWSITVCGMRKISRGTFGYQDLQKIKELYGKKGFKF